jgi:predicted PurR-regulated permease PerM
MGAALGLLGVPYALLLGFIVAIFQAIPMVGAIISGPIVLLVVLATTGWAKMLIALAVFVVVQMVDQNVLSPMIFGQRVQLSFLLIIFATVVGGMLLGIAGAFLAVPAAAALQVIIVQIIAPAVRRANRTEPEAQVDSHDLASR